MSCYQYMSERTKKALVFIMVCVIGSLLLMVAIEDRTKVRVRHSPMPPQENAPIVPPWDSP